MRSMRTYTRESKTYISVTEIVGMMYPFNEDAFRRWAEFKCLSADRVTEEAQRIGTLAHSWVQNRVLGIADWADVPPLTGREENYLRAAERFVSEVDIVESERVVYSDEYLFAGTFDARDEDVLYDIKTWGAWKGAYKRDKKKLEKVAVQLSMYRCALGEDLDIAVAIFLPDGNVSIEELDVTDAWQKWIRDNRELLDGLVSCEPQMKFL